MEPCKLCPSEVNSGVGPKGDVEVIDRGSCHKSSPLFYVCNPFVSKGMRCTMYEPVRDSARGRGLPIHELHAQEGGSIRINDLHVKQDASGTMRSLKRQRDAPELLIRVDSEAECVLGREYLSFMDTESGQYPIQLLAINDGCRVINLSYKANRAAT